MSARKASTAAVMSAGAAPAAMRLMPSAWAAAGIRRPSRRRRRGRAADSFALPTGTCAAPIHSRRPGKVAQRARACCACALGLDGSGSDRASPPCSRAQPIAVAPVAQSRPALSARPSPTTPRVVARCWRPTATPPRGATTRTPAPPIGAAIRAPTSPSPASPRSTPRDARRRIQPRRDERRRRLTRRRRALLRRGRRAANPERHVDGYPHVAARAGVSRRTRGPRSRSCARRCSTPPASLPNADWPRGAGTIVGPRCADASTPGSQPRGHRGAAAVGQPSAVPGRDRRTLTAAR